MSSYYNLAKLGRVKLPTNTEYALIDADGRAMIAPYYTSAASYSEGDYVIGTGLTGANAQYNDNLLKAKRDIPAGTAFNISDWEVVTVADEFGKLRESIKGGVHYRGKTSTLLYDGATTNPIIINGDSYTAEAGDLVIVDLYKLTNFSIYIQGTAYAKGTYLQNLGNTYYVKEDITSTENTSWNAISSKVALIGGSFYIPFYSANTAIEAHTYFHNLGTIYYAPSAITASENTSLDAIQSKINLIKEDPEFLYDGGYWQGVGSATEGLGDLAYKDTASGTYVKPTGTGSVTIKNYTTTTKKLATTTITGINGTETVSKMTAGTAVNVATVDTAKRYGTANVGTAIVYGTANRASSATTVGNANVGEAVAVATQGSTFYYGTADVDSSVTVATAGTDVVYGKANVGAAVTYGNANVGTTVTGIAKVGDSHSLAKPWTTTNNTGAITCAVSGDCLSFAGAAPESVIGVQSDGVDITQATTSNTTLTPAVAAPTTQKLTPVGGTTSITPAKSAGTAHSAVGVGGTRNITPAVTSTTSIYGAVAAPDTQTLTPATEAPGSQTIVPAKANGSITPWTESTKTVAKAAANAIRVATGVVVDSDEQGASIVTNVTGGTETASVIVNTVSDAVVTVK